LFSVGLWIYWYWFKRVVVAHAFPFVFLALAGIEILGPLSHLIPEVEHIRLGWRIALIVLLLLVAALLLIHHHRLQHRCGRHEALLASIDALLAAERQQARSGYNETTRAEAVTRILDALVFALEFPNNHEMLLNATVLIRPQPETPFRIAYQDSRHFFPPAELALHPTECVAGKIAEVKTDALIYVPSTKFRHGVQLSGTEVH
jgi:hypothetical protein